MDALRLEIARNMGMGKNALTKRADSYVSRRDFRAQLNDLWRRHGDLITGYVQQFWAETITDIHVDTFGAMQGKPVSRDFVVSMSMQMNLATFTAENEAQWMQLYAGLATLSWLANREDQMVDTMIACTDGLLARLGKVESNQPTIFLSDIRLINRLATVQFEIMAHHRAELEAKLTQRTINRKGLEFIQSISDQMGQTQEGSKLLNDKAEQALTKINVIRAQSDEAATISEQTALAMQDAASTASGLVHALDKVGNVLGQSHDFLSKAEGQAKNAVADTQEVSNHVSNIESILQFITDIASQTNLLALNATIEAARAGEAGRGFAVVAEEVKMLANQTADATERVARQIQAIQKSSGRSLQSNRQVVETVSNIRKTAQKMESDIQEQAVNISSITSAIDETALGATSMGDLVGDLRAQTAEMASTVELLSRHAGESDFKIDQIIDETRGFMKKLG